MTTTEQCKPRGPHPLWGAPLIVALTFLLVGCYTILRHPITSEEGPDHSSADSEQASHQEYYRGQCLDCHQDYASYPYGFFYGVYPDYYFEYPRIGYYYAYPWWWDRLWYENADPTGQMGVNGEPGEDSLSSSRKASRRGGLIPPYVGGAPVIDYGGYGYQRDGGTTTGKAGNNTGEGAGTTPGTKIRVKASDTPPADSGSASDSKPKPSKKASRRGGGTP